MANPDFTNIFASGGTSATISNVDYLNGWHSITASNTRPPSYKEFNRLQHDGDIKQEYLDKRARNIWDAQITYEIGAYALGTDGQLYKCLSAHTNIQPVGNPARWGLISETAGTPQIPTIIGSIVTHAGNFFGGNAGALLCDGSAISRASYADLFAIIGTTYGAGNGSTSFNIPDLRGEFIRGLDNGRGVDSGRTLGSYQHATNMGVSSLDMAPIGNGWSTPFVDTGFTEDPTSNYGSLLILNPANSYNYGGSVFDYSITMSSGIRNVASVRSRNIAMHFFIIYAN